MGCIRCTWTSCLSDKTSQCHSGCDGCISLFKYSVQALESIFLSSHSILWSLRIFLFLFEPFFFAIRWPYLFCDYNLCNARQSFHPKSLYLWFAPQSIPHRFHAGSLGRCTWIYFDVRSSPSNIIGQFNKFMIKRF